MAEPGAIPRPSQIGPYAILDVLGSGGMGVVYRARDPRLSREVALKVIHETTEADPRWRQRFADEARAAAALNHPHILAVHDVAIDVVSPYIVSELIDGNSLRDELKRGAIRLPRLIDLAAQMADGLAAAHQAGLVHRDLKPENVMVTRSSRVKIVDFGLAKSTGDAIEAGTTRTITAPHTVVGTPAYMSPEQARGDPLDFRSDLFSFGAVLYEMITGRLAFDRPSSIDTLSAILHDEPRPLSEIAQNIPADLHRIVGRCLAKNPGERYGATADLLHDLQWLKSHASGGALAGAAAQRWPTRTRMLAVAAAIALALVNFVAGWRAGQPASTAATEQPPPKWQRLTFEQGFVHQARFGPDGETILYAASWNGQPFRIYSTTTLSPESRALDLPPAGLLAVSRTGQLALSMDCVYQAANAGCMGTLGQAPLLGGAPRGMAENVRWADWGPDGNLAAIVSGRLEYPVGTPLADAADHVRFSPDGRRLAYTSPRDGALAVVVREGAAERVLASGLRFAAGLAWAPDGNAVYWSGSNADIWDDGITRTHLGGTSSVVLRSSPRLRVLDVDARNRLLVDHSDNDTRAWITGPNDSTARDITWLGSSIVDAMSDDGKTVLLTVRGGPTLAGGREKDLYPIFSRPTDGAPATFLGNGYGLAISPDGQWALTITRDGTNSSFVVYPLRVGASKTLDRAGIIVEGATSGSASFASSSRIVFEARVGDAWDAYAQPTEGPPRKLTHAPGRVVSPVAPNGEQFLSQRTDGSLWLATVSPGAPEALPWKLEATQVVRRWTGDGREIFVVTVGDDRLSISRVDVRTGRAQPHSAIPRDPRAQRAFRASTHVSRDGKTIAYTQSITSSALHLIEGVR